MRFGCLVPLLLAPVVLAQTPPQTQVPGAIRSRVVLVPVDVRAVGRDGDPVTDLRQADFTIEENGVAQTIAHFATQTYTPQAPPPASSAPPLRRGPGLEPTPVTHRTFAVVLGRGRLQGPSKGLDAVIDFVRTDLLPQDRVAVLAYGRATDLTTDRDPIVRLLERYRERHTSIEALLDQYFDPCGLAFIYRTDHPPHMKPAIDALFSAPGLPAVRQVAALEPPDVGAFERDRLRTLDAFDRDDRVPDAGYVIDQTAREDLEKLHGAIEYLRYLEGEKHLVFVTEEGMHGVTRDQADRLAAAASDARVTISPIHTAGVALSWSGNPLCAPPGAKPRRPGTGILMGPSREQVNANADLRAMASLTGGQASIYKYASGAFDRLDRGTRFHYVLGYYPANATWDGSDRRIKVTVRRRGVTVLHRHSYYAREDLVPFDRREFLTHTRVAAAGAYRQLVSDVSVTLSASVVERRQNPWQASVKVMVDPATIAFAEADGRHVASIDIAVFVGSRNQRQVGEVRKRVDLNLLPESYARLRQDGVAFTATIDLTAPARYVKAVVYDYAADRLGSAVAELR